MFGDSSPVPRSYSVGALATRTPHRPLPVGLSIGRVVSVDVQAGTLTLAGADLVDGGVRPRTAHSKVYPPETFGRLVHFTHAPHLQTVGSREGFEGSLKHTRGVLRLNPWGESGGSLVDRYPRD